MAQAEPLDKCAVADYEQIQCGQPGISGAECEAINCCFITDSSVIMGGQVSVLGFILFMLMDSQN